MRPRRQMLSRRQRQARMCHVVQLIRLEEIARGEREPDWPREEFFRRVHAAGDKPDPADFIMPPALLALETRGLLGKLYEDEEIPADEPSGGVSEASP